jgi:hypothetical protein
VAVATARSFTLSPKPAAEGFQLRVVALADRGQKVGVVDADDVMHMQRPGARATEEASD